MNEEDTDWLVYHRIPDNEAIDREVLCERCGLSAEELDRSLARLESSCLIEQCCGRVRMLTFGEALLKNQCKYEKDLPYTIENGVIKMRKNEHA